MPLATHLDRKLSPAATSLLIALAVGWIATAAHAAKPQDYGFVGGMKSGSSTIIKPGSGAAGTSGMLATSAVNNLPLCAAPNDQSAPIYISDGNGGGIAVWSDRRAGNYDIYAQRIDASGDALWPSYGVVVSKAAGDQINPQAVSDGAGGVIVAWEDGRTDPLPPVIYAQRLSASGVELWTADGVLVSTAVSGQTAPVVVSDGLSGAIVAWRDLRNGDGDIFAQRIPANGVPSWTVDGVAVCVTGGEQDQPAVVSDGAGGVLVAWRDRRGAGADVYAQRVSNSGTAAWAANGVGLCTAAGDQEPPAAVSDGTGGMVLAWGDARGANSDIFAQRVSALGAAQWTADGVSLCAATGNQTGARLCMDGANGAIVTWEDRRGANADVYAQRVSGAGAAMWTANGVAACNAAADQTTPSIAADPMGAAIIAWSDRRTGANGADIYAQRLTLAAGAVSWLANGTVACDTLGDQAAPSVISDGQGGASMAWRDFRGGAVADLYAQRVDNTGMVPAQCASTTALSENAVATATNAYTYYTLNQQAFFWAGVGVRPAAGTDWDLEVYEPYTFGQSAYPICFLNPFAGSFNSSGVDFVIGDFNPGYTPIPPGGMIPGVRVSRYSGAGNGSVEWDGAENTMSKDCQGGNCGASSSNNWSGVLDIWDVFLFANTDYTFDFTKTGTADIKFLLFKPPVPAGPYLVPRSAREFETNRRYTVYRSTVTGWHGVVLVNDNGTTGTYSVKATTGILTTGVGDGVELATGLRGIVPNPARGAVRFQFALKQPGDVSLRVIDMAGRRVGEVPTQHWGAGAWSVVWNGKNPSGESLAAGVYFVEMLVNGQRVGQSRVALIR